MANQSHASDFRECCDKSDLDTYEIPLSFLLFIGKLLIIFRLFFEENMGTIRKGFNCKKVTRSLQDIE